MDYLPVCLDVRGQRCVIVGGGEVAARKAGLLLAAGAEVHVVAPALCAELEAWARQGRVSQRAGRYASDDLAAACVAVAATDDAALNARVAADARRARVPVNVVDAPEHCTFIMPAIVDRSPLLIAISTSGASPVLARMARAAVERALPEKLGELARWAAKHRARVAARVPSGAARRGLWERVLEGAIGAQVLAGRMDEADAALERALAGEAWPSDEVVVVIDPAGDSERLTLAALRALSRASLVLACGAADATLGLARRDAPRERLAGSLLRDASALSAHARARALAHGPVCLVVGERELDAERAADLLAALRASPGEARLIWPGPG